MKMLWKFTLALILVLPISTGYALDNPADGESAEQVLAKRSNDDVAREIVESIMDVVGLKMDFEIISRENDNAVAVIRKGKRHIEYDPKFLQEVNDQVKTNWAGVGILAHEIAHHLNGHTLTKNKQIKELELEADEFAGFVLRKMGASLKEAQAGMYVISNPRGSKSHPDQKSRLKAIKTGWQKADKLYAGEGKYRKKLGRYAFEGPAVTDNLVQTEIVKDVHFLKYPDKTYHITEDMSLVGHTSSGEARVIGEVIKSKNKNLYLKVNGSGYFLLNSKGEIVSSKTKKKVGYMVSPKK